MFYKIIYTIFFLVTIGNNFYVVEQNDTTAYEVLRYRHYIGDLKELKVEDVNYKRSNNDYFILYVGRETCVWCRELVPMLSKLILEEGVEIYYLDSQDTEINVLIKEFRDTYGIKYVPSIVVFFQESSYRLLELNITSDEFDYDYLKKLFIDYELLYQ